MPKKVEAAPWSYSKWKAFDTCPFQFEAEKVLKLYPFKETEAIRYGNQFHKAAEEYVKAGGKEKIDARFDFALPLLNKLLDIPCSDRLAEQKRGVTEDLEPCGYWSDDVWYRGLADLNLIDGKLAWTIDYKTGSEKSMRYADMGQTELMALQIFADYPKVEKVRAAMPYVVANGMLKHTYYREDEPKLWKKWIGNFRDMEKAFELNKWAMKESGLCRKHCQRLDCPHNGRGQL